ncbi:MAG: polyphosphate kinase 1 [Flavobacteriaceae bacterium]
MKEKALKNRDVNWLYFNERVLLEASNPETPLLERLKFLAIFSSNLDEFFKVRIAQLRQLKNVDKNLRKKLISKANKKLKFILKTIDEQQNAFGDSIRDTLKGLREYGVYIRKMEELDIDQKTFLGSFFQEYLKTDCSILNDKSSQDLKDGKLYIVVHLSESEFAFVAVPTGQHGRFIEIPGEGHQYIYLEDIIKLNMEALFPNKTIIGNYTIKISRDAELYLEDDYMDLELVEVIYKSLGKRKTGQPTRLLYDINMPKTLRVLLKEQLDLSDMDMFAGGEYHNLSDFFGFPNPFHDNHHSYASKPALQHKELSFSKDIFQSILKKDQLVHFPYQEFGMVERFVEAAATDKNVVSIKMSLYRIAKTSILTDAILQALENDKHVVLFVEAQARFDEENNIKWGRVFEEKGAKVIFSVPNIKVHSKIALVERQEEDILQRYAYIGTGNFNAKTAKLYCDHGLFTAHNKITADLAQVFGVLERKLIVPKLKHLLVSPFTTRSTFIALIANAIDSAKAGKNARITLKMNSLEDSKMIMALSNASEAGVEVRLLVRGFCCLKTKKTADLLDNEKPIFVTSIVDRYLEHGRIYLFETDGTKKMYIGSADWMTRNLDKRIEVLTPILDKDIFGELNDILQIQLNDNVKARILDRNDKNERVLPEKDEPEIRSQYAIYDYLKAKLDETS